jgi:hypothetical protein
MRPKIFVTIMNLWISLQIPLMTDLLRMPKYDLSFSCSESLRKVSGFLSLRVGLPGRKDNGFEPLSIAQARRGELPYKR